MKANVLYIVLCVFLIGCLRANAIEDNNSIVGKWENDIISTEFFEDGTYIFLGPYTQRGTWSDLGNETIVVRHAGGSSTASYEIKNNILTLLFNTGDEYIFTRVENLRINENIGIDDDNDDEILRQFRLELIEALQNDPHDDDARNLLDLVNLLLWGR